MKHLEYGRWMQDTSNFQSQAILKIFRQSEKFPGSPKNPKNLKCPDLGFVLFCSFQKKF